MTVLDVQTWLADRKAKTKLSSNSVSKAYKVLRMVMRAGPEPRSAVTTGMSTSVTTASNAGRLKALDSPVRS